MNNRWIVLTLLTLISLGCGKDKPDVIQEEITPERQQEIIEQSKKVEMEEKANRGNR